jgi:hypothetical protein
VTVTHDAIAGQLKKDFMHRVSDDTSCAVCGANLRPLAFHTLQKSYSQNSNTPKGFVPVAMSMGSVRGAFPVCNQCAPACSRCGLPIPTEKTLEFGKSVGANVGNGVCRHIHIVEYIKTLTKRAFHIGRFKRP